MRLILILLAFIPLLSSCQKSEIEPAYICWKTSGVDSNLIRLTQITSKGATRLVTYINEQGTKVEPSGGTMLYGICECCNPTTTEPDSSQIIRFITSQPTFNPLNPGPCNSNATILLESTVEEAHISIELNGSPVPFSYFPAETPRRASASYSSTAGSGINTVVLRVTNTFGTESETRTFDCGG